MELKINCLSGSLLIRHFAVFIFLCMNSGLFAQNLPPTRREVMNAFKSRMQRNKKEHSFSNSWIVCNHDSSFFKSGSIQLVSDENYPYYKNNCCDFVSWTFLSKKMFSQSLNQVCREPASAGVLTSDHIYTLKMMKKGGILILQTQNRLNKTDQYSVISIEKIEAGGSHPSGVVISLQRLN